MKWKNSSKEKANSSDLDFQDLGKDPIDIQDYFSMITKQRNNGVNRGIFSGNDFTPKPKVKIYQVAYFNNGNNDLLYPEKKSNNAMRRDTRVDGHSSNTTLPVVVPGGRPFELTRKFNRQRNIRAYTYDYRTNPSPEKQNDVNEGEDSSTSKKKNSNIGFVRIISTKGGHYMNKNNINNTDCEKKNKNDKKEVHLVVQMNYPRSLDSVFPCPGPMDTLDLGEGLTFLNEASSLKRKDLLTKHKINEFLKPFFELNEDSKLLIEFEKYSTKCPLVCRVLNFFTDAAKFLIHLSSLNRNYDCNVKKIPPTTQSSVPSIGSKLLSDSNTTNIQSLENEFVNIIYRLSKELFQRILELSDSTSDNSNSIYYYYNDGTILNEEQSEKKNCFKVRADALAVIGYVDLLFQNFPHHKRTAHLFIPIKKKECKKKLNACMYKSINGTLILTESETTNNEVFLLNPWIQPLTKKLNVNHDTNDDYIFSEGYINLYPLLVRMAFYDVFGEKRKSKQNEQPFNVIKLFGEAYSKLPNSYRTFDDDNFVHQLIQNIKEPLLFQESADVEKILLNYIEKKQN